MSRWQKFRRWDERREQNYLLGRWERVRAKGKGRFVVVENLTQTLIVTTSLSVSHWLINYGFDVRAIFPSDIILRAGFIFICCLIINSFLAEREWNSTEKRYRKLKESRDSGVLITN